MLLQLTSVGWPPRPPSNPSGHREWRDVAVTCFRMAGASRGGGGAVEPICAQMCPTKCWKFVASQISREGEGSKGGPLSCIASQAFVAILILVCVAQAVSEDLGVSGNYGPMVNTLLRDPISFGVLYYIYRVPFMCLPSYLRQVVLLMGCIAMLVMQIGPHLSFEDSRRGSIPSKW